jgi:hypothetical protein
MVGISVVGSAGTEPRLLGAGNSTIHMTGVRTTAYSPAAAPSAQASSRRGFTITGSVGGLYPGDAAPLVLTVTNPQDFAIDVTSLVTSVATASGSCPSSYLSVSSFAGHLHIAARGAATTTVDLSLSHSAPDACQGAQFQLAYSGQASKP